MSTRLVWISIALLSFAACLDSLWLHLIQFDEDTFARVCTIVPGFDCAPALTSHYSRVFSIPLSSFGFVSYLLFALMAVQSLMHPIRRDRNALLLTLVLAASTVFTSWLAWVSTYRLRAYCPLCLVLHIITPLLFIASLVALSHREQSLRRIIIGEFATIAESRMLTAGAILLPLLLAIGLPLYHHRARERQLDKYPEYRELLAGNFRRMEGLREKVRNNPAIGRVDAPVELVEFADFTCPLCAESRFVLEELAQVYDIRVVFVNHPRSRECNPWAETDRPGACMAGLVATYAHARGKYWPVHDALFDQIELLGVDSGAFIAKMAGAESLIEILTDTKAAEDLARDIEIGHASGVTKTPSLFINGMGVEGIPDRWFLEEAIENEIDRVRNNAR